MKLYCVRFYDAQRGQLLSWHASKSEAERTLRLLQATARENGNGSVGPDEVEPMDIPTDRAGLLSWLNLNFDTSNG